MPSVKRFALFIPLLLFTTARAPVQGAPTQKRIIMIHPAGDAKVIGRKIHDTFERSITLQCAHELKTELESARENILVIITRSPGDTIAPLQNAQFANRMGVDLFISLHCYQEPDTSPKIDLYQFASNDTYFAVHPDTFWTAYDKAHLTNYKKTAAWATQLKKSLSDHSRTKNYPIRGVHAVPFASLIGISCPAIGVEISTKHPDDWRYTMHALAQGIKNVLFQEAGQCAR